MGLTRSRTRRDEGRVTAKGSNQWCGAVDDEVKASAIVRRDTRCGGVDEPLLGHHVSFRPNSFAGNLAPRSLNQLGSPSQEASAGPRKCMLTKCIHQLGGHTQVPRRSRNGQARAGVGAGVCDAMRFAWFRARARCGDQWGWPGAKRRDVRQHMTQPYSPGLFGRCCGG